jgi:hypothetical protein
MPHLMCGAIDNSLSVSVNVGSCKFNLNGAKTKTKDRMFQKRGGRKTG